jgi:hypothetical protein
MLINGLRSIKVAAGAGRWQMVLSDVGREKRHLTSTVTGVNYLEFQITLRLSLSANRRHLRLTLVDICGSLYCHAQDSTRK